MFLVEGVGFSLIQEWTLINFLGFQVGRLFEVGAYSKVGALSNKYGTFFLPITRPYSQSAQFNNHN